MRNTVTRFLLLILLLPALAQAVVREGSGVASTTTTYAAGTPLILSSFAMPAGTEMLVVVTGTRANMASVTDDVNWNSGTALTLTRQTTTSGGTDNTWVGIWCLMNPAITTADIYMEPSGGSAPVAWLVAVAYSDVPDDTCANNIALLAEDVDDAGTVATAIFSSAGTAGNTGFIACNVAGDDSSPMSNDAGFAEIQDDHTGGGAGTSADLGWYVADSIAGLPSAITVTPLATDEHACIYVDIATAVAAGVAVQRRRQMQ